MRTFLGKNQQTKYVELVAGFEEGMNLEKRKTQQVSLEEQTLRAHLSKAQLFFFSFPQLKKKSLYLLDTL